MSKSSSTNNGFYQHNPALKWVVLIVSVFISIGSIYYTNVLVEQLKAREHQQGQLFARAVEYRLNNYTVPFASEEIINKTSSVPTTLVTRDGQHESRNIHIDPGWSEERRKRVLEQQLPETKAIDEPIEVTYSRDGVTENYGHVYYR